MASPYDEDPEAIEYRNTCSQLLTMCKTAADFAAAGVTVGVPYETTITGLSATVEPVHTAVTDLGTAVPWPELVQYREAVLTLSTSIFGFL